MAARLAHFCVANRAAASTTVAAILGEEDAQCCVRGYCSGGFFDDPNILDAICFCVLSTGSLGRWETKARSGLCCVGVSIRCLLR